MTLTQWLTWLFTSGGSVMVASWILERIPSFVNIVNSETKKYVFWVVSVVISAGAYAILTYVPAETLAVLAPYFGFAFGTFGVIFLGTAFHFFDKSKEG